MRSTFSGRLRDFTQAGSRVMSIALVAAGIMALDGVGFLIQCWWIRGQNPARFREYD
ncbi:MAG: hypothetical protein M0Q92_09620 [Methanoregula sp.]|nr:hypothetical protein [Methanoregula sp.]